MHRNKRCKLKSTSLFNMEAQSLQPGKEATYRVARRFVLTGCHTLYKRDTSCTRSGNFTKKHGNFLHSQLLQKQAAYPAGEIGLTLGNLVHVACT